MKGSRHKGHVSEDPIYMKYPVLVTSLRLKAHWWRLGLQKGEEGITAEWIWFILKMFWK